MTTIDLTLYGDQAREICEALGIVSVGDTTDINAKIVFTVKPASGRYKVALTFDI